MATAVDTSVLLDVLLGDPMHATDSEAALLKAANQGGLMISEVVIAEIMPVLKKVSLHQVLSDWQIDFMPSSLQSAKLAGEMYRLYLERGGKRGRVVPDFLIAAHAQIHSSGLLARDRGYYRDYFKSLKIVDPTRKNN